MRVYRHSCLAATSDLDSITVRAPQFMASATKTVLALVTGGDRRRVPEVHPERADGRVGIPRNHWVWLRDRSGNTIAAGGLFMRPDDEARLGELMLRNGLWAGQQVITADYIAEATTGTAANAGYGFLTWLNGGDWHMNSVMVSPRASSTRSCRARLVMPTGRSARSASPLSSCLAAISSSSATVCRFH